MSILGKFLRARSQQSQPDDDTETAELTIETMRRSHLEAVMQIEHTAYPQPWTIGVFQDELAMQARGSRHYLVAKLILKDADRPRLRIRGVLDLHDRLKM